jgi:hypothetical protein
MATPAAFATSRTFARLANSGVHDSPLNRFILSSISQRAQQNLTIWPNEPVH